MVRLHFSLGVAIFACRLLDSFLHMKTMAVVDDTLGVDKRDKRGELRLKLGALFDDRSRHLTQTFQAAVKNHNSLLSEQDNVSDHRAPAAILLEPVVTYVDVTDSFAVSNAMCSLMAHDIVAIVGITNASSLPTIQSYSATFHVPFISLGSSQNLSTAAPFQLLMRPPLMAAVVDLLDYHDCTSALYVYDSDEDEVRRTFAPCPLVFAITKLEQTGRHVLINWDSFVKGLMRIQDLFQAINVREIMLELDVRRVGDKSHVTEMSSVFRSLHVARDVCILLDLEQDDPVTSVAMLAQVQANVKDIILVTMDVLPILHTLSSASWRQGRPCNISGFQLLPLEPATTTQHPPFPSSSHQVKDGVAAPADEVKVVERGSSASPSPATHSARGLIADTLLVLQAALTDVLQADGNIFLQARNDDGDTEQRQEKSMKCTSFVVDKKEHGDTLMDALRVVHVYGETGHVSFDSSGKREHFSFSVYSIKSGATTAMKIGLWTSVSGLSSHMQAQEIMPTYIILGNVTSSYQQFVMKTML